MTFEALDEELATHEVCRVVITPGNERFVSVVIAPSTQNVLFLAPMTLSEYIRDVGDDVFAAKFGVPPRTAASYRLGQRTPRRELSQKIVAETPVTWEGIYAPSPPAESAG